MFAALGGADLLVFTGGVGEHDAAVRRAICADLAWAGVPAEIDMVAPHRYCRTIALSALEEDVLAQHVRAILTGTVVGASKLGTAIDDDVATEPCT